GAVGAGAAIIEKLESSRVEIGDVGSGDGDVVRNTKGEQRVTADRAAAIAECSVKSSADRDTVGVKIDGRDTTDRRLGRVAHGVVVSSGEVDCKATGIAKKIRPLMQSRERATDIDCQVHVGINHAAAAIVQSNAGEIGGEISVHCE